VIRPNRHADALIIKGEQNAKNENKKWSKKTL
jgi:hypothetical protein